MPLTNGKVCEQVKDIEGFVKEEVTDIRNKVTEEKTRETDKISAPYHFVVGARGLIYVCMYVCMYVYID